MIGKRGPKKNQAICFSLHGKYFLFCLKNYHLRTPGPVFGVHESPRNTTAVLFGWAPVQVMQVFHGLSALHCFALGAIAFRLEAIASRLEAIALGLEATREQLQGAKRSAKKPSGCDQNLLCAKWPRHGCSKPSVKKEWTWLEPQRKR